MSEDPRRIVREGYDAISRRYRRDDERPAQYEAWAAEAQARLPTGGQVLDLGCGCGVPLLSDLAATGHDVTGVDASAVQIARARALVPAAHLVVADLAEVAFPATSFDLIACVYAIIHVPAEEHAPLLRTWAGWLRPGGWVLLVTGDTAWTGTEEDWLGGGATMWWSHPDRATSRAWLLEAGLEVVEEQRIPEGAGAHAAFWARRPVG